MNSIAPVQNVPSAPVQRKPIRFNARSFVAFALAPEAPLAEWFDNLDQWTENSPGFFAGRLSVANSPDGGPFIASCSSRNHGFTLMR